jgi:hypothetical protein
MRNPLSLTRSKALILIFLLCLCESVRAQNTELTIENYCQLTKSLMELSVREWRDRLSAAGEQKQATRKEMIKSLDKVASQYRKSQNQLYKQYGIGRRSYLHYASDHKTEIEGYLEEHQDVRGEIESLREQINGLIQQFETTVPNRREGEQQ